MKLAFHGTQQGGGSSPVHKEPTGDFSKGKAFLFSMIARGRQH